MYLLFIPRVQIFLPHRCAQFIELNQTILKILLNLHSMRYHTDYAVAMKEVRNSDKMTSTMEIFIHHLKLIFNPNLVSLCFLVRI